MACPHLLLPSVQPLPLRGERERGQGGRREDMPRKSKFYF